MRRNRAQMVIALAVVAGLSTLASALRLGSRKGRRIEPDREDAPAIEARADFSPRKSALRGHRERARRRDARSKSSRSRLGPQYWLTLRPGSARESRARPSGRRDDDLHPDDVRAALPEQLLRIARRHRRPERHHHESVHAGAGDIHGPRRNGRAPSAVAAAHYRRALFAHSCPGRDTLAGRSPFAARGHLQRDSRASSSCSCSPQAPCSRSQVARSPTAPCGVALHRPFRGRTSLRGQF